MYSFWMVVGFGFGLRNVGCLLCSLSMRLVLGVMLFGVSLVLLVVNMRLKFLLMKWCRWFLISVKLLGMIFIVSIL